MYDMNQKFHLICKVVYDMNFFLKKVAKGSLRSALRLPRPKKRPSGNFHYSAVTVLKLDHYLDFLNMMLDFIGKLKKRWYF